MIKKTKRDKISDVVYRWISDNSKDRMLYIKLSEVEKLINKIYKIK